jgi:hypothetical protein
MKTITDFFNDWMLENGFDENDQNALTVYTWSGDREKDYQDWRKGLTDEEAFLQICDECEEAGQL